MHVSAPLRPVGYFHLLQVPLPPHVSLTRPRALSRPEVHRRPRAMAAMADATLLWSSLLSRASLAEQCSPTCARESMVSSPPPPVARSTGHGRHRWHGHRWTTRARGQEATRPY
jgi:hypothetical protein